MLKMLETKKEALYGALIALVVLLIAGVVLFSSRGGSPAKTPSPIEEPTERVVTREVEKLVEVEKVITADILRGGLNGMGVLIAEEYCFTEVVSFSSVKHLLKTDIELGFTESSYLASYDGVVTAGVDFKRATVIKDDEGKRVTVRLPKAEIQNVDVDPNSFTLYSEKTGLGNPLSVSDFNHSLVELENTAQEKAIERGILECADENAAALIKNFVGGLVDLSVYTLHIVPV